MVRQIPPRLEDVDEVAEVAWPESQPWQRREAELATFEPTRVAGSAGRGSSLLAAWLGALVALVGLAGLGPATAGPETGPARLAVASSEARATSPAVASPVPPPLERPIAAVSVFESRSSDPDGGVSRRLEVDGRLFVRAARVRITLEAREDRIVRTIVRQPYRAQPRTGPVALRVFSAVFDLPSDRWGGMWVTVTAFDAEGGRLGRVRQRVEVYPLLETLEWR